MARIEAELTALGRTPNIGEVVWFTSTAKGDERCKKTAASCARCGMAFDVPTGMTPVQRAEINRRVQKGNPLGAIRLPRLISGLPVRQAKAVVLHLTEPGPGCHQCRESVLAARMSECASCRSLNINWQG